MDGESSSPEGGPDTPPNTPVTPSHKTTMEHHRQWRELEKSEPEPATCLGQHHHQRHHFHNHYNHHHHPHHHHHHNHHDHDHDHHHYHRHHHNHDQHHHNSHKHHHNDRSPVFEKKSYDLQGICDVKAQSNNYASIYSCYHAHWCIASTPSTPRSSPIPASPTLSSLSSNCSSEEELEWQQSLHPRITIEKDSDRSTCKSIEDDNDDNDDEDADQNQDQDHSDNLPNPGTLPLPADTRSFLLPFILPLLDT